jgi:hypothetical protein
MPDHPPDLHFQLVLLGAFLLIAVGGALLIEIRQKRKEDEQISQQD